jgi:hypothetical protein
MRHKFTDLEGKRYVIVTCDQCHCLDRKLSIVARPGGRDMCPECWDEERMILAEASMFICSVCGERRTISFCATCIL